MYKKVKITFWICAIVFGILDLITQMNLLPFMALSMAVSIFIEGLTDKKNNKSFIGYMFIALSFLLVLLAIRLFLIS